MARTTNPVHKLSTGRWQVRYRDDDGAQRKRTFDTARDAQAFLDTTRSAVRAGTYIAPDAGRVRFSAFAEQWAAAQDWKASTRDAFDAHLRRLEPLIGRKRLDQVDELELLQVRTSLMDRYARSTATITLHYACAVMRAAHRTARIPRDPTAAISPPRRRDGDEDGVVTAEQLPTRDELLAIMAAAPDRYRAAVVLGACGLRIGEVMGVTADRLDLEAGQLRVERQLQRHGDRLVLTAPKREKRRTIGLPSWARFELRRHLRDQGPFWSLPDYPADEGLLFRGGRDAPLRRDAFYDSAWRPALVGAGLAADAYVFHSLRHWCASSMLAEGAPITAVAGHLGDTVETVSRTYAHWLRDDRDVPAMVLDRLLAPGRSARSDAGG